jgi:hypothetical protein
VIERVEVVPGPGTVIRFGAVVVWAAPSASPALISFLAQSARNLSGSARGGRQMADHIAGVLRERDPEPHVAFAVVGPDSLGWASLLHGPVQAWDGQRWLAPSPSPGWLQAVITPQPSVMVNAAGSPVPVVAPDSMWDLEAGVVPGSGFVLFPSRSPSAGAGMGADPVAASEAGQALPEPEPLPEPAPPTTGPAEGSEVFAAEETTVIEASPPTEVLETIEPAAAFADAPAAEPLADRTKQEIAPPAYAGPPGSMDLRRPPAAEPRSPLPAGLGPDRSVPGAPVVGGLLCEREHLNRPGMRTCVRCGSPVRTDTMYTVSGSRPPLGCLVGDDGTIWRLDKGYLIGSNPANDPTVRGGIARPLSLEGAEMAAGHAEIKLTGWEVEVVDRSSPGGTFVFEPGSREWQRLRPYDPRTLRPGTHIAFGQRVVTFLTPWVTPAETAPTGL